ncbi:hypothetical protein SK128_026486 [Halocaridina rubra]|uniref:Uncharacterized protein n=1 Tax=Halocaridina rubra TaxID=373956 RepID=A0AAN9A945_HALRR
MTTSSTPSPQDGRDPGVTLIRISPARIQTQVTQTVRYRPVRSLLLLGILVVVSLVVLFTLSQMAFVQHTMMAQLETGRPGGGAWVGSNGGGRISRPAQKPWKSQFNQFKIEPLLIRNAPSVEVNTALAANRRRASQVAAIIMKNSLLVTESPYYNLSLQYIHLAPDNDQNPSKQSSSHTPSFISLPVHKEHIIHLHNMSTSASHLQSHGIIRAPSQSNLTSSSLSPLSSSMSSLASTSLSLDRLPPSSNPRVRHSKERGALIQGSTSLSVINTSSNNFFISSLSSPAPSLSHHKHDINSVNTSTKVLQNHKNKTATDKTMYDINNNKSDKMNDKQSRNSNELSEKSMRDHRKREENVRKRFFRKLGCADSDICDSEKPYYENHKVVINKQIRENQQRKNETKNKKRCVNDSHKECYTERKDVPKVTEKFVAAPVAAYSLATTAKPSESIESESESLPTEFSPSEKDFEPLYLREDDSYDSADEEVDTLPSTPPDITTKATTPTDKELRKLSVCPEIPPGLRKLYNDFLLILNKCEQD